MHDFQDRPLGAEARFFWGDQQLADFFLSPHSQRALRVGSGADADFTLHEPALAAASFELLQVQGERFRLRLPRGLDASSATLTREGRAVPLDALPDEDGMREWMLESSDALRLTLGGIRVEVERSLLPRPARTPWQESMDLLAVNSTVAACFLLVLFLIEAGRRRAELEWADDLNADLKPNAVILVHQEMREQTRMASPGATAQPAPETPREKPHAEPIARRHAPAHGVAAHPALTSAQQARDTVSRIFSGFGPAQALFRDDGSPGLGQALAGVRRGPGGGPEAGLNGLQLHGPGLHGPGGGLDPSGIGKWGRQVAVSELRRDLQLTRRPQETPSIQSDEIHTSSIDPELVRRVIHSHRDQIRYCYELELVRVPDLAGKVKVHFAIGPTGSVVSAEVVETSAHDARLEGCIVQRVRTWLFAPLPFGGLASVSYPFVFKPSGE